MLRLVASFCMTMVVLAAPSHVAGQSAEEFYKHKKITVLVGYEPGGGYDLVARQFARHLGKYLPGNPSVIVQNMPGAGTLVAANYIYNIAPKDGTVVGLVARNMPLLGLLGKNPNVRFDPRKFTWLGSSSDFSKDSYVLIARKDAPVKTIQEAQRSSGPQLVLGGTAPGAAGADVPRILRDTLGLNIRLILGYTGSSGSFVALERGEVSGLTTDLSALRSNRPSWLQKDSDFHVLVQFARITRHPAFLDVPTARELAPNDAARALIEFTEMPFITMAMPFAAPPGIPEERTKALREAFDAVHRDPEYLAEAASRGIEVSPVRGHDVADSIDKLSRAAPELFDYVRKLIVP